MQWMRLSGNVKKRNLPVTVHPLKGPPGVEIDVQHSSYVSQVSCCNVSRFGEYFFEREDSGLSAHCQQFLFISERNRMVRRNIFLYNNKSKAPSAC